MKRLIILILAIGLLNASCKKEEKSIQRAEAVVSSISPARGRVGTVVTISGENFSRLRTENAVKFNGVDAKIITFNEQNIYVEVPEGGTSGAITVSVANQSIEGPAFQYMDPIIPYMTETFAGNGTAAFADGMGTEAKFNNPEGVAIDSKGNIIVADRSNHRIRKITPDGQVSTIAGSGTSGRVDGPALTARFNSPWKVAVDKNDNIIVADRSNHCIRLISADGIVSTIAGNGSSGTTDGIGTAARFNYPQDVEVDPSGVIYVVDYTNDRIRKITTDGTVSTLAGGSTGYADGTGTEAQFNKPSGLVLDKEGNLLVADRNNNRIRKVTPAGVVTTFAGNGSKGLADGDLLTASFGEPFGINVDPAGNIFIADLSTHAIRKITVYGEVITIGGNGTTGNTDGSPASAVRFNQPTDVVIDAQGRVYVADLSNAKIRRLVQQD